MTARRNARRAVLLAFAARLATAQQTIPVSPTYNFEPSSGITSSPASATPPDNAMALWTLANSLLDSYYPSASVDDIAALPWPDNVVIGGTTFNLQSLTDALATATSASSLASSATATSSPSLTTSPSASLPTHQTAVSSTDAAEAAASDGADGKHKTGPFGDKKLAIILGVVIGLVALILVSLIFWCLRRRKNDTGSFFMRRRTPSIAGSARSEIRSWLPGGRSDTYGNTSYVTAGHDDSDPWSKQHPHVSVRPQMAEPRRSHHPAFAAVQQQDSSRSTSEENPFYTPAERLDAQLGQDSDRDLERGPYDPHPVGIDDGPYTRPRSSDSLRASGDRPPTPFSPMEMMGFGASQNAKASRVERRDFGDNPTQGFNPFSSPEDEENDIVSPILPSRNAERRHSPMVHYPSWSEVSEFDFHGNGRRDLRNMSSNETDGGDGWHPVRERTDGRYELA